MKLTEFTHGIIAIASKGAVPTRAPIASFDGLDIYHYCGYPAIPSQADFDALAMELVSDPDIALDFDFVLEYAPKEVEDYFSGIVRDYSDDEALVEAAARKVLKLEGAEFDDLVASLQDGKESPREASRWRIATEAARVALNLASEARNAPDVHHKGRGSVYTTLGEFEVQTKTPIVEGDVVTGYRCCESGKLWARPVGEFNDGRFERLGNKE